MTLSSMTVDSTRGALCDSVDLGGLERLIRYLSTPLWHSRCQ